MLYLWVLKKVKHPILREAITNFADKMNLKENDKYDDLSNLSITV